MIVKEFAHGTTTNLLTLMDAGTILVDFNINQEQKCVSHEYAFYSFRQEMPIILVYETYAIR